jgi:DnaJ-domain-containing protein 1
MVSEEKTGDDVLSLDEVFDDEETVHLILSSDEWEVIIALAETGGMGSVKDLRETTSFERNTLQEVIGSLLDRGILTKDALNDASEAAQKAPDAEVTQYLEYLMDLNYYQILQLGIDEDAADVRRAYFRLMREYHPDRFMKEQNPETKEQLKEIFRILTQAYETLSDPELKREYDLSIPDFTGAEERENEMALESLWSGAGGEGELPEQNPELAKSFFESALESFTSEDYVTAELNYKLAVALDPTQDDYHAGLAKTRRILHKKRAREGAIKAIYFEDEGKYRNAITTMMRSVELDPEVAEYRYDLARILEAYGNDLHSARMHVLLALDRHPGKINYLLLFGKIQKRLGELSGARRTLKRVISLESENKEAKETIEEIEKMKEHE